MLKDRFSILICSMVFSFLHFQVHAQVNRDQPLLGYTDKPSPVLYQELNKSTALIRNRGDLQAYLGSPLSRKNPLGQLTTEKRQKFVDGLVFASRGLASFEKDVLEEMSPVDAYATLALFGFQHALEHLNFQTKLDALNKGIKSAAEKVNSCGDGANSALCDVKDGICEPNFGCIAIRGAICSPSSCQ